VLERENLMADDAIAADPLLVCLFVCHETILSGTELMSTRPKRHLECTSDR
jgi:hypothetical protein